MTKVKILALLAGLVLLFTLPATVSAQRLPPHVFVGVAMIDGAAAPEWTTVSAWAAGAEAASTTTTGAGGDYTLIVDQGDNSFAGETVTFLVGGMNADQSAEWMQGGGDELTLSASSAPVRGESVTLALDEQNDSGQSGTATLTEVDSTIEVVLSLSAGTSETDIVHIHSGQCGDTLGGVVHTLTPFVGGSGDSTTIVEATLASVQDGDHAINATIPVTQVFIPPAVTSSPSYQISMTPGRDQQLPVCQALGVLLVLPVLKVPKAPLVLQAPGAIPGPQVLPATPDLREQTAPPDLREQTGPSDLREQAVALVLKVTMVPTFWA